MNFILPFNIPKAAETISFKDKIVCIGSCFAQEIGQLMQEQKLDILLNPHGILYNSCSISKVISDIIENKYYTAQDLIENNGKWHSLDHHGSFSDTDLQKVLDKINHNISKAHVYLRNADWLCITVGSSWAYKYKPSNAIIVNCHKIPQDNFTKELIQSNQQTAILTKMISGLKEFNPRIKILFTISPVKYIRDGIIENNLSKAHLITTVNTLCGSNSHCYYFPAYELVTDILRDYRFYKEDMVHPNEQAIKFVWDNFIKTFLNPRDVLLFEEITNWQKYSNHRALDVNSREISYTRSIAMEKAIEEKLKQLRTGNN